MASIIKLKRSSTAGQVPGSLEEGELAINVKDERLISANSSSVFTMFDGANELQQTTGDFGDRQLQQTVVTSVAFYANTTAFVGGSEWNNRVNTTSFQSNFLANTNSFITSAFATRDGGLFPLRNVIGTRLQWNTSVNTSFWSYTGSPAYEARQSRTEAPPYTAQADSAHNRGIGNGVIEGKFYIELLYTVDGDGGDSSHDSFTAGIMPATNYGSNLNNSRSGNNGASVVSLGQISGSTNLNDLTVNSTTAGIIKIGVNLDDGEMSIGINNGAFTTTSIDSTKLASYRTNGAIFFGEWWDGNAFLIRDPNDYTYTAPVDTFVKGWGVST